MAAVVELLDQWVINVHHFPALTGGGIFQTRQQLESSSALKHAAWNILALPLVERDETGCHEPIRNHHGDNTTPNHAAEDLL